MPASDEVSAPEQAQDARVAGLTVAERVERMLDAGAFDPADEKAIRHALRASSEAGALPSLSSQEAP